MGDVPVNSCLSWGCLGHAVPLSLPRWTVSTSVRARSPPRRSLGEEPTAAWAAGVRGGPASRQRNTVSETVCNLD